MGGSWRAIESIKSVVQGVGDGGSWRAIESLKLFA